MSTPSFLDDSTQPLTTEEWASLLDSYAVQLAPHLHGLTLPTLGESISFPKFEGRDDDCIQLGEFRHLRISRFVRSGQSKPLEDGVRTVGIFCALTRPSEPVSGEYKQYMWGYHGRDGWLRIDIVVQRSPNLPGTYECPMEARVGQTSPLVILRRGADPRSVLEALDAVALQARERAERDLRALATLTDRKFGIWATVAARESEQG